MTTNTRKKSVRFRNHSSRRNAPLNPDFAKKRIPGELFLVLGMLLNSMAVSLLIKADFGISAISSVPYVLYVAFPVFSVGIWNAIIQCTWLLLTMLVIRRFKPGYIFSFVLAFIFGLTLDFWRALMSAWSLALLPRLGYFAAGFCIMAVGISMFFMSGTPVLPFDTAPRAIVIEKGVSVRTARTVFDVTNLILSLSISLFFLGRVVGIGVGTVVAALLMGTAVGAVNKWVLARYEVTPYFAVLGKLM